MRAPASAIRGVHGRRRARGTSPACRSPCPAASSTPAWPESRSSRPARQPAASVDSAAGTAGAAAGLQAAAHLAADDADARARRRRRRRPRRAPRAGHRASRCVEAGLTRERDDARRLVELLEPAENLRLLRARAARAGRRRRPLRARRADVVEPAAELDGALGADIAPIEMGGPLAGRSPLRRAPAPTDVPDETPHQLSRTTDPPAA